MKTFFNRWKNKSESLGENLLNTLLNTLKQRIYFLFLPFFLVIGGKHFDFFNWKTLDVSSVDFWNPRVNSIKRELQTDLLWENIQMKNVTSVLELGSLSGYRLFEAAEKFPHCKFTGVDFSVSGVTESKLEAKRRGLSNLEFIHCDITSDQFYESFAEKRFDVVFSFATLMYIHPRDIRKLIGFITKLAIWQVVLIEQSSSRLQAYPFYLGAPVNRNPNWIRNYGKILDESLELRQHINLEVPVPSEIWSPGGGNGKLIILRFQ
jgi:SAM-dependent methyltransferase